MAKAGGQTHTTGIPAAFADAAKLKHLHHHHHHQRHHHHSHPQSRLLREEHQDSFTNKREAKLNS
uniref:Uncharacterized protein n=1 Tax=Anguilla anguilla TaxID=7936 RepID=A0A0E9WZY5_ANGAN